MKGETVDSSENIVDRGQVKSFEDLIVWQDMIYPLIPIYSLLTTKLNMKEETVDSSENIVDTVQVKRFEDIIAWQKAKELTIQIYSLFEASKDFGFNDQIQRASVSIMNNIAEGFERKSNKEFKQFLYFAKGSCGEVRSMLIIAHELKKINTSDYEALLSLSEEISKILFGLINKL